MTNTVHFQEACIPEGLRIYAIGDVHGRLDLLKQMHGLIDAECVDRETERRVVIHLGDYVDRGPESSGVLEFLCEKTKADADIIALAGNHDRGFLEFLHDGKRESIFPGNGGGATALSYGIDADFSSDQASQRTSAALWQAVPGEHIAFLQKLPVKVEFGDFFFCHAGVRPTVPLEKQSDWDLVWIRYEFLDWPELFEKVIVHGHTPHDAPEILPNRVNVDTAAYMSGVLTALVIEGSEKRFLEAREEA